MNVGTFIPQLETAAVGTPITRIGVSFFPIYLPGNSLPEISTGSSSGLVIEELPNAEVPVLSAHNPTQAPILIVEGEHLVGGKQNRSVNTTILVPKSTKLEIPVTCLEQGRWGRSRKYTRANLHTPPRIRTLNQNAVASRMRDLGSRARVRPQSERQASRVDADRQAPRDEFVRARMSDQGRAWSASEEMLRNMGSASPTSAVSDADQVYERDADRRGAVENLSDLGPLPRQSGFAVAHGRWVIAIELFGTHKLLKAHWTSLIRSYMLEPAKPKDRPSATVVLSLLRKLGSRTAEASPGIGEGTEQRVRGKSFVVQALTLSESIVHCSAFWNDRDLDRGPATGRVGIPRREIHLRT